MQPQQPYYGPPQAPQSQPPLPPQGQPPVPPPEQNPYDFIMNNAPAPKRSFLSGSSTLQRAALVFGGIAILLLIVVGLSSVFGGSSGAEKQVIVVAQEQQEIARVAGLATQQDNIQETTKELALNTQLTLSSQQQDLLDFMHSHGVSISSKQLGLLQNSKTDQKLSDAATNSTYDSTFTDLMKTDLAKYQSALTQTFSATKNAKLRELLQSDYADAGLLLTQAAANQ